MTQELKPRVRIGAGRFAKRLDQRDVSEPVEKFLRNLDHAFGGVEGAFAAALPPVAQRAQHVAALRAVELFLMDVDWIHAERFAVLAEAIEDLNFGARHPLLLPIKKTARPLPSQVWRAKAAVVGAIEALILVGEDAKGAVRKILHDFPAIENLVRSDSRRNSKAAVIKAILEWRRTLRAPSRHKANAAIEVLQSHDEFIDLETDGTDEWYRDVARQSLQYAARVAMDLANSASTKQ